jgi:hypothetical protein
MSAWRVINWQRYDLADGRGAFLELRTDCRWYVVVSGVADSTIFNSTARDAALAVIDKLRARFDGR